MKKRFVYVVHDSLGVVSYHRTLDGAKKRGEGRWMAHRVYDEEPRVWQAGRQDSYHVVITEVRLWE